MSHWNGLSIVVDFVKVWLFRIVLLLMPVNCSDHKVIGFLIQNKLFQSEFHYIGVERNSVIEQECSFREFYRFICTVLIYVYNLAQIIVA